MYKYIILLAIAVLSVTSHALAQNDQHKFALYSKTIDKVLSVEGGTVREDSVYIYAFNFQLELSRNNEGKLVAGRLDVNDSLAYKIFPRYNLIKAIDFSFLDAQRKKFKVIIPVIVYFKNHKEKTSIDFDVALNAAYSVAMPTKTSNNGPFIPLMRRESLDERSASDFLDFRNNIFMPVRIVHLYMIR